MAFSLLPIAGCGGGSSPSGPSPVATPTPSPVGPVYDVPLVVFYDEDGDRQLSSWEHVRLPEVVVEAARHTARATGDGKAVLTGIPAGPASLTVRTESLPPFYQPPTPISVQVPLPAGSEIPVPITLPIGANRTNRYLAFGDSISVGEGSTYGSGYRGPLQESLNAYWGAAILMEEAVSGTRTTSGANRIAAAVASRRPAYTLILYGTNDWNECGPIVPCVTVDNLRRIVESVKGAQSLPVIGTIIPANPDFPDKVPPERNQWIASINALIRPMARTEGATLADLEAAFLREPNLPDLFTDHVHPNDHGYRIMADEFFRAITQARGGTSTVGSSRFSLFALTANQP